MHNNTCVNVHTTNVYRHVGSVFSVGTSVLPDVKAKTYAMTNDIPLHIRRLLRNEGLAIKTKLAVAQSYLVSKGLSSASVWPTLRSLEATTFSSAMFRVFRLAVGDQRGPGSMSDEYVLGQFALPHPSRYIDAERVGLLCRIVNKKNKVLLTALAAANTNNRDGPRPWIASALQSINVARLHGHAGAQGETLAEIASQIEVNPKKSKK